MFNSIGNPLYTDTQSFSPSVYYSNQTYFIGAPIVVSFPHFLYADWRYVNNVKGLSPNETNHQIFVNLEPVSELFTFFSVIQLTDVCRLVERP